MNSEVVRRELLALSLPLDQYVVVGGGVLALHDVRETEDIDLVVTNRLFNELQAQGWKQKTRPNGKPGLKRGVIEAYLDVNCDTVERSTSWLLEHAVFMHGIPTIDLQTLRAFKAGYGRPKDLHDLALLSKQSGANTQI
jgi:hypothetical protein